MSACVDIEIRPELGISPKERAEARDSFVRAFESQFQDWTGIAKVCLDVERDKDYEVLGYSSWHQWILAVAPKSRSYIYLVTRRYEKLSADIPEEELDKIPLSTAGVLTTMSTTARRDPKIRKAAQNKRKEFIEEVKQIAPEQHIEARMKVEIDFTVSQWSVIEATFEKYKVIEGECSIAEFFEWCCSEISDWTLHADKDKGRKDEAPGTSVH